MGNTTKSHGEECRQPAQDLNTETPEYKAGVPTSGESDGTWEKMNNTGNDSGICWICYALQITIYNARHLLPSHTVRYSQTL
jgi:hypothetical protein